MHLRSLRVSILTVGAIVLSVFTFGFSLAVNKEKVNELERKAILVNETIDEINRSLINIEKNLVRLNEKLEHITK